MRKLHFTTVFALLAHIPTAHTQQTTQPDGSPVIASSPSGNLHAGFGIDADDTLYYFLNQQDTPILNSSRLGITIDGENKGASVALIELSPGTEFIQTYSTFGKHSTTTDHHNRYHLTMFRNGVADPQCGMEIRVYDDGMAFRFTIPGSIERTASSESTEWNLPSGSLLYYQTDTAHYEGHYQQDFIGTFAAAIGPPLVARLPQDQGYVAISEASLHNYSGMTLQVTNDGSNTVSSNFLDDATWTVRGGHTTPWRFTLFSNSLNGLVNSDLIMHLNPSPRSHDLPGGPRSHWIKPGRTLWSEWTVPNSSGDFNLQKQTIDYAHRLGFEYILLSEGWETGFADGTSTALEKLFELAQYGLSEGRNVGVWVTKDRTELDEPEDAGDFLFSTHTNGAVGVKFVNIDNESSDRVQWCETVAAQAAITQMMLNFADVSKPTGEFRSFPNELTRGAVQGLTANPNANSPVSPEHNATIPFTRLLAGHADYAPVTFDPARLGATTVAHQLAMAGLITSPLMHWPDNPSNYLAQNNALDVITTLPTTWDETIVMNFSSIGQIAAMARRTGKNWFLFIINGDANQPLEIPLLDLAFLGNGNYQTVLLSDNTPTTFNRQDNITVNRHTLINASLLPGGGFIGMFNCIETPPDPNMDSDGDGIADLNDCAPDDPTLSSLHTFYADFDRDHYGNPDKKVQVCSTTPEPPLVAWAMDPNDFATTIFPAIKPKGNRLLGLDFATNASDGRWRNDLAREIGVEITPLALRWDELETSAGVFDGPQVTAIVATDTIYAAEDIQVSLSIDPIYSDALSLPLDLKDGLENGTLRWNDAQVIDRFLALLDFVHSNLPNTQLHALQIGYDVDTYHSTQFSAQFWSDYDAFFIVAKNYAKSLWGEALKVGIGATLPGLITAPTQDVLKALNLNTDFVAVSYFPRKNGYKIVEPEHVITFLESLIANYPTREIHFSNFGYPSSPGTLSSETKQSQFLRAVFEIWDRFDTQITSFTFAALHDPAPSPEPTMATRYFDSVGLRRHDGTPKAAYKTMRNLAFERGWWRILPTDRRSFLMGFSEAAYDYGANLAESVAIDTWMRLHLFADSDIFNIQIDAGIPWPEAYADTFESAIPPYHQDVLIRFNGYLEMVPPGHKKMVAISPNGVPRSHINAYWGEGVGYSLAEGNFGGPLYIRAPGDTIGVGTQRFPPEPWNTLPFDHEMVKTAFTNYAKRVIDFFEPDYLLIALEISAALVEEPEKHTELVELLKHVYTTLKAEPNYQDIPLVVSISSTSFMVDEYGVPYKLDEQSEGVLQKQIDGLAAALPYMDIIGLSHYPHYGKYNAYTINASMYDSLFEILAQAGAGDKPIAITESGYSADAYTILQNFFNASEQKQDDYFKHLFYELSKVNNPFAYIINWQIRDNDLGWQRTLELANAQGNEEQRILSQFNQYFRDIGLFDGDGNEDRPALARWRNLLRLPVVKKELSDAYPYYMDWVIKTFYAIPEFNENNRHTLWGLQADFDRDGRNNLLEYFHHSNPISGRLTPGLTVINDIGQQVVRFPVNLDARDTAFQIECSPNLQDPWLPIDQTPVIVAYDAATNIAIYEAHIDSMHENHATMFYRLRVDYAP